MRRVPWAADEGFLDAAGSAGAGSVAEAASIALESATMAYVWQLYSFEPLWPAHRASTSDWFGGGRRLYPFGLVRERLSYPGFPRDAGLERLGGQRARVAGVGRVAAALPCHHLCPAGHHHPGRLQPSNSPRRSQLKHSSPHLPTSPHLSPQVPLLLKQLVLIRDGATPDPWGHLS